MKYARSEAGLRIHTPMGRIVVRPTTSFLERESSQSPGSDNAARLANTSAMYVVELAGEANTAFKLTASYEGTDTETAELDDADAAAAIETAINTAFTTSGVTGDACNVTKDADTKIITITLVGEVGGAAGNGALWKSAGTPQFTQVRVGSDQREGINFLPDTIYVEQTPAPDTESTMAITGTIVEPTPSPTSEERNRSYWKKAPLHPVIPD